MPRRNSHLKHLAAVLSVAAVLFLLGVPTRAAVNDLPVPTDQIIIRFDPAQTEKPGFFREAGFLDRLSATAGVRLTFVRPMSGGAFVYRLPEPMQEVVVADVGRALTALPEVVWAEPDAIQQVALPNLMGPRDTQAVGAQDNLLRIADLTPDDPAFADQWHYRYTPGEEEGVNLPAAWALTTGSDAVVVAVLDTGILPHADLVGRTVPGYDFIYDPAVANDGDGRDSDPSDPGDWVTANQCYSGHPAYPSTWHGTHVAGTIGAAADNGLDVAGVNWRTRILPVRVLGTCGGYTSDIADGIRWAAGLPVPGAPPNLNPARVLNLSLGGAGTCSATYQSAFDDVLAVGVVAVVAAGNRSALADFYRPASCQGVITVAATTRLGDQAWYSNYGSAVEVSAPGGEIDPVESDGILSTLNTGTAGPDVDSLAFYQGTSMAAPHVAGVAALLLGERPGLTPAQVSDILQATARDFPQGSTCAQWACGAGIVDAFAALSASAELPPPNLTAPADGATLNTATPTFTWAAVNGAQGYGLVVATDETFSAGPIDTVVTDISFTPLAPLADGTYYWRVNAMAEDGAVFSPWSEVWSFTIDTTPACTAPGVPAPAVPDDGATTDDSTPSLAWAPADAATLYEVQIATDSTFDEPVLTAETAEIVYTAAESLEPDVYYWRVRGRHVSELCDEPGEWSVVWSFTVEMELGEGYRLFLPAVIRP